MKKFTYLFAIGILLTLISCGPDKKTSDGKMNTPVTSKKVEKIMATPDQRARREKSEADCKAHNIPVYKNPNALFVEAEANVTLREKDAVVDRAIALAFMEIKSEGPEKALLDDVLKRYDILKKMSPLEKQFALNNNPSQQEMANANWRAESHHVLLWALGYIDELKYPAEMCQVSEDFKHLFSRTEDQFRADATLRSKAEILDAADQILRYNWAITSERLKAQGPPGNLNSSVVFERHYALNWLVRYMNQDWDDVSTDT